MKFSYLLKAVYANAFIRKDKKGQVKKPSLIPTLLTALILTAYLGYASILSYLGLQELDATKELKSEFFAFLIAAFMMMYFFFSTTFAIRTFFSKDVYAFLFLPIKGRDLFLAKFLLSFYLSIGYGGLALLVIPTILFILDGASVIGIILYVLFAILLLFAVTGMSFLFAMLLYRILPLESHKGLESFITILLSIFGGVYMVFLVMLNPTSIESDSPTAYLDYISSVLQEGRFFSFFGYLPREGFYLLNPLYIVLSFLIVLVLSCLSLEMADHSYFRLLGSYRGGKSKKKVSASEEERRLQKDLARSQDVGKVYFRKEAKRLFSQPAAYLPTLTSILSMFIVFFLMSLLFAKSTEEDLLASLTYTTPVYFLESMLSPLLSYSSVSLEKNDHEMMKAYPLTTKKILVAKVLPSTLFYTILYLIEGLFLLIASKTSLLDFFPLLFLGLTYGAGTSFFAFFVGCKRANFSWTNPAEISSRGFGPFLIFLYSFLIPGVLLTPYYLFLAFLPKYTFVAYLISLVPSIALMIVFYHLAMDAYQKSLSAE